MIHPSAHIHPQARLGSNVRVGPGAVIDEHVEIGDDCEIRAHAILTGHTKLGKGNQIGYGAVIGSEPQDLSFAPETVSYTEIGDQNIIREMVTIHRGTKPESVTRVGNGCFLMATAHLAHNCQMGDGAILGNSVLCAGYVEIGSKSFIAGNAVLHQFCRVGRLAIIRGGGRIGKDVPPFMVGDSLSRLMGLNTVGLKRAGFSLELRMEIKRIYHQLFLSELNLSDAVKQVDWAAASPEANELKAFIETSKRGVVTTRRGDAGEG